MKYQVLIVDDEEIVCRGLAEFIRWEQHGFQVAATAYSVDDALRVIERQQIDVVLTDIRMPEKSGIDLIRTLHETNAHITSIILSGHSDFAYAQEAIRYGAVDYLTKPMNFAEVEGLLDRLYEKFSERRRHSEVHRNRAKGILLSIARGYAEADPDRYLLPDIDTWYGIAISLQAKHESDDVNRERVQAMKQQLKASVPDVILLDSALCSIFAILPFEGERDFMSFIAFFEQACCLTGEWGCGVSKQKQGIGELAIAWQEANQALRFYRAGSGRGISFYKNIESIFNTETAAVDQVVSELLQRIRDPGTRASILDWIPETFSGLMTAEQSLTEFQTISIRCLIELNGYVQGMEVEGRELHPKLNHALNQILMSDQKSGTVDIVIHYTEWLIGLLEHSDGQALDQGVICEIQLYIRQHYNENISLTTLADQFYLHPNYLSHLFKEKTGENYISYMTNMRMDKAIEYLTQTDYKIIEISSMIGYSNPRYFNKVFKQHTDLTPGEYREQYRDEHRS